MIHMYTKCIRNVYNLILSIFCKILNLKECASTCKVRMVWCAFRAIISPSNLLKVADASMDVSADAISTVNDNWEGDRI